MALKLSIKHFELEIEYDDTPVKLCHKCGEWWPATGEFFWRQPNSQQLRSPCKACIAEQSAHTNATKPCCVAGCSEPRLVTKAGRHAYNRCAEHQREQNRMSYLRKRKAKS